LILKSVLIPVVKFWRPDWKHWQTRSSLPCGCFVSLFGKDSLPSLCLPGFHGLLWESVWWRTISTKGWKYTCAVGVHSCLTHFNMTPWLSAVISYVLSSCCEGLKLSETRWSEGISALGWSEMSTWEFDQTFSLCAKIKWYYWDFILIWSYLCMTIEHQTKVLLQP